MKVHAPGAQLAEGVVGDGDDATHGLREGGWDGVPCDPGPACVVLLAEDEAMNTWLTGLAIIAMGCGEADSTAAAPELTGVWAVTLTYEDGSCPDVKGGSQAAMWTVNRDDQGTYAISVQGDDKMPTLSGVEEGSFITLTGFADSYPALTTQYRLSGSGALLTGRAIQARQADDAFIVRTRHGEGKKDGMCAVIWNVKVSKQGT